MLSDIDWTYFFVMAQTQCKSFFSQPKDRLQSFGDKDESIYEFPMQLHAANKNMRRFKRQYG